MAKHILYLLPAPKTQLAIEIEMARKESVETLIINSSYIHSMHAPQKEAARRKKTYKEQPLPSIQFGLGLGYILDDNPHKPDIFVEFKNIYQKTKSILTKRGHEFQIVHLNSFLDIIPLLEDEPYHFIEDLGYKALFPNLSSYFRKLIESYNLAMNRNLRIGVISPIYGGSYPISQYCAQILEEKGYQTRFLDHSSYQEEFFSYEKDRFRFQQSTRTAQGKLTEYLSSLTTIELNDQPVDIALALAQAPLLGADIDAISRHTPIGFWFVEDFRTLPYWEAIAGHYDLFYMIQSQEFSDLLTKAGQKNLYVPTAAYEAIHRPAENPSEIPEEYKNDLAFMGAPYPNRVNCFEKLTKYDLSLWGPGWEKYPQFKDCLGGIDHLSPQEYIQIFQGSKINLNIHSSIHYRYISQIKNFVNPRLFEISACRGFQLVDRRDDLSNLYDEDEMVYFDTIEECKEKIDYYLEHPEERTAITEKGYKRTLSQHTYWHRLKIIMTSLIFHRFDDCRKKVSQKKYVNATYPEIEIQTEGLSLRDQKALELSKIKEFLQEKKELNPTDFRHLMLAELVKIYD